jgi:tRNA(Arg) A34 adenosine deaminase TadA
MKKDFTLSMPRWLESFTQGYGRDFSSPEKRMDFAIALSAENVRMSSGGPFGAAVFGIEDERLISCGVNVVENMSAAVAHAEIMALSLAQQALECHDLGPAGLELASSAQPCLMCYGATIWSGIRSLLVGARGSDVESITGFDEGPVPENWVAELEKRGIRVTRDLLRSDACAVLRSYKGPIYNSSANLIKNP